MNDETTYQEAVDGPKTHVVGLSIHGSQVGSVPQVLFTQDNTEAGQHPESYWMDEEVFAELGEPQDITIQVFAAKHEPDLEPFDGPDTKEDGPDDGAEILNRDAGSGQFVTDEFAKEHPDTTVTES